MFLKFLEENVKLEPCPFCGGVNLEIGVSDNPFIVWDGAVRGERVAYVVCECGAMIKLDTNVYMNNIFDDEEENHQLKEELQQLSREVAKKWNKRMNK